MSASALERETKEAYRGDEVLRYDLAITGALVVRRRETRMKKWWIAVVFLCFIVLGGYLYLRMGTLMLLPAGELAIESSSPSGGRLVRAYFIDPGAAGRTVVRAEVVGLEAENWDYRWR